MLTFDFVRWLKRIVRPHQKPIRKKSGRFRLSLEQLEDRLAPAGTYLWTGGGGANTNWSNAANWSGPGGAPAGTGGDILVFGVNSSTATDDIAAGIFKSISFAGTGIVLQGPAGGNSM